jgi:hypothetical protein
LTYSAAGAASGQYLWLYRTVVVTETNTGSSTYAGSISANSEWFQTDAYTYYTYPAANGAFYTVSTPANTVAPTTGATQLSLAIPSISFGSASGNVSGLGVLLYDPNGNLVVNTSTTTATAQTFTYSNVAAIAGSYVWKLYAYIATNAANASENLVVTIPNTSYIQWYQAVVSSSTVYYSNAGNSYSYTTPSVTVAPTAIASALSFNIASCTAPANSYGTSQIVVSLLNPSGVPVTTGFQYSTDSGTTWTQTIAQSSPWVTDGRDAGAYGSPIMYRYYNASAPGGVYTWVVYGQVNSTATGDSSYNCSWSGTQSWYQVGPAGGNTYVLAADGITQRLSTTDQNVLFTSQDPSGLSFQISNNAAQAVSFSLGVDVHGV